MNDATEVTEREWAAWQSFATMRRRLELTLERQLQRDAEISAADYAVLLTLFEADNHQLRPSELGDRLFWEKSRVSHQITRMEKRDLVTRTDCEADARGTWVELSPAGSRAVVGAMREHAKSLRTYFFDVLTPDELELFKAASDRVIDTLEPAVCEALDANTADDGATEHVAHTARAID